MVENFYQAVTGKAKFVRLFWGKTIYCVWLNNEKIIQMLLNFYEIGRATSKPY
jgi:hypothetical protein